VNGKQIIRASLVGITITRYLPIALNSLRTHHAFRISLIVAMLLGWFVFSQRCALGQMLKAKQAAAVQHGCCAKSGAQSGQPPADGRSEECCQALSVLVPDGAKAPEATIADGFPLRVGWVIAALELRPAADVAGAAASPPPDLLSFTELVLHRSLRSHAPPVRA